MTQSLTPLEVALALALVPDLVQTRRTWRLDRSMAEMHVAGSRHAEADRGDGSAAGDPATQSVTCHGLRGVLHPQPV